MNTSSVRLEDFEICLVTARGIAGLLGLDKIAVTDRLQREAKSAGELRGELQGEPVYDLRDDTVIGVLRAIRNGKG